MNTGSWQPDPTRRHEQRWWDGTTWTDHVADHGIAGTEVTPTIEQPVVQPAVQPVPPAMNQWRAPYLGPAAATISPQIVQRLAATGAP